MTPTDHEGATQPASARVRLRDAERTRAALLKAGLGEFAKGGLSGGRLERIVRTAGCNIRMVYHYYGGKEGLYAAVLQDAYARMRDEEARLDIDVDRPLAGLLELMRFNFEFFQRNPKIEALLRTEGQALTPAQMRAHTAGPEQRLRRIGDLVASGRAKGLFRDDLEPLQIYVTIAALSRFHLIAGPSVSALVGAEVKSKTWLEDRLQHCLAVLEATVLNPSVKKRFVLAPAATPPSHRRGRLPLAVFPDEPRRPSDPRAL